MKMKSSSNHSPMQVILAEPSRKVSPTFHLQQQSILTTSRLTPYSMHLMTLTETWSQPLVEKLTLEGFMPTPCVSMPALSQTVQQRIRMHRSFSTHYPISWSNSKQHVLDILFSNQHRKLMKKHFNRFKQWTHLILSQLQLFEKRQKKQHHFSYLHIRTLSPTNVRPCVLQLTHGKDIMMLMHSLVENKRNWMLLLLGEDTRLKLKNLSEDSSNKKRHWKDLPKKSRNSKQLAMQSKNIGLTLKQFFSKHVRPLRSKVGSPS